MEWRHTSSSLGKQTESICMFGKNWFLIAKLLDASGCKHLQLEPSHSSSIGSTWTAFLTNHGHGAGTGSSADTRYSLTSSGPKKQNSNKNRHIQTHKNPYSLWMSMDTGCKLWIEPFQITRVNKWVQSIIARAHQTRNHKQCRHVQAVSCCDSSLQTPLIIFVQKKNVATLALQ